ncbi:MAG: DUF4129 domain-containing protein [Candidatus Sedimenticola sp. (ex Thyasira tokunagai)]
MMDLNKMTVTIRPRNAWEGIDLGFAMARHWLRPLWMLWLVPALPVYLLAALLLSDYPWAVIMLVWWLKPLYEPLLLFWLSRRLFDEAPGVGEVLRRSLSIVRPQLFANLTWRRFNPNRSFNMPVAILEQLKGKERKRRVEVLGRGQHAGTWLTIVGIHFETLLELSFMVLLIVMLPEELRWVDMESFVFTPGALEEWLQHIGSLLAMSLIAPFYVAGGFALYLTRRSELEAWDIEINFRRLRARRKTPRLMPAAVLMLASLFLVLPLPEGEAAEVSHEEAKVLIKEVLQQKDFGKLESESYWKYIGKDDEAEDKDASGLVWLIEQLVDLISGFTKGFAAIGELLMWIAAGLVIAMLLYIVAKNRGWFAFGSLSTGGRKKEAVVSLFGLEVAPDSLPENLPAAIEDLLGQGDLRGAMSLLYRGALVKFIHQDQLEIPDSATEGECLQQVVAARPADEAALFQRLTWYWTALAYGHEIPAAELVMGLSREWSGLIGRKEGGGEG